MKKRLQEGRLDLGFSEVNTVAEGRNSGGRWNCSGNRGGNAMAGLIRNPLRVMLALFVALMLGAGSVMAQTVNVTYVANNGTAQADYVVSGVPLGSYTLPDNSVTNFSVPSGKEFKGWGGVLDGTGINTPAGEDTTLTSSITFYALWDSLDITWIWNWQDLASIDNPLALAGKHKLARDLDKSSDYYETAAGGYGFIGCTDLEAADPDNGGWYPLGMLKVGIGSTPFTGDFNGNGKSISDLWLNRTTIVNCGLFATVGAGAYIYDLIINLGKSDPSDPKIDLKKGIVNNGNGDVGGLAGGVDGGTIGSITVGRGEIQGRAGGGIIGSMGNGKIAENAVLSSAAEITTSDIAGGVIGNLFCGSFDCDLTIGNGAMLSNTAKIIGGSQVGGVIGRLGSLTLPPTFDSTASPTTVGVSNTGAVTGTGGEVGGLFGDVVSSSNIIIANYTNTVPVSGRSDVGGVVGRLISGTLGVKGSTITNKGLITATSTSGYYRFGGIVGMVGFTSTDATIGAGTTLINTAEINGNSMVGGVIGQIYGLTSETVFNSTANGDTVGVVNTGKVIGTGDWVGGLFGYVNPAEVVIANYENTVEVTGSEFVGGVVGQMVSGTLGVSGLTISNTGALIVSSGGTGNSFGGIVGTMSGTAKIAAEATLNNAVFISGNDRVGGVIGHVNGSGVEFEAGATLSNGVGASMGVKGHDYVGGVIGYVEAMSTTKFGGMASATAVGVANIDTVHGHQSVGGLFGQLSEANVTIFGYPNVADIAGDNQVGGIVGSMIDGTITDCLNMGEVRCGDTVPGAISGGIVGYMNDGKVTLSRNEGFISGGVWCGGIVGAMDGGEVSLSCNDNNLNGLSVDGGDFGGGLVGVMNNGTLIKSYNLGRVVGGAHAGGVVGHLDGGFVEDCYSLGHIVGTLSGGVVGLMDKGTLQNAYGAGRIESGAFPQGAINVYNGGTVDNVYYDKTTSRVKTDAGGAIGLTTTEMTKLDPTIFRDGAWGVEIPGYSTYPYLQWQYEDSRSNDLNFESISVHADGILISSGITVTLISGPRAMRAFNTFATHSIYYYQNLNVGNNTVNTLVPINDTISIGVMSESDIVAFDPAPEEPDTFYIWNWADLAYLNILIENEYGASLGDKKKLSDYSAYVLMQNLVRPEEEDDYSDGTHGGADSTAVCLYMPEERRKGSYGYQNYNPVAATPDVWSYDHTIFTGDELVVGMSAIALPGVGTITGWNDELDDAGWISIGVNSTPGPFSGIFDGQGFQINGLWIDGYKRFCGQGLFGYVLGEDETNPAIIKNLGLELWDEIKASCNVGGLIGIAEFVEIYNCYAYGLVTGVHGFTGGLIGEVSYIKMADCHTECTVEGFYRVGGLIGSVYEGIITNCYTDGEIIDNDAGGVEGQSFFAGLIGEFQTDGDGYIANCYSYGRISLAGHSAGGFVGEADGGKITDCYSHVEIYQDFGNDGLNDVGGLIGRNGGTEVSNCYAETSIYLVEQCENVGGLVGSNGGGSISNCYVNGDITLTGDFSQLVGGLVGFAFTEAEISNCYTTSNIMIEGEGYDIGGLVGYANDETNISNCYATGSITVEGDDSENIGGLVGYIESGATLSNSFAFAPQITVGSAADNVGRVAGYYDDGDAELSGNQAMNCMKVIVEGAEISYVNDPDDKDGDVIDPSLVINEAGNDANYSGWNFTAGAGAWTFDYAYGNPAKKYNVTSQTNLPILQAFDTTAMGGFFADAEQPPYVECVEHNYFEIWNWADLAYLTWMSESEWVSYEHTAKLMQDLVIPEAPYTPNPECPYSTIGTHPERAYGGYGYQNWNGLGSYSDQIYPLNLVSNMLYAGVTEIELTNNSQYGWETNGWRSIGGYLESSHTTSFTRHFDGNNKTISGLWKYGGAGGLFEHISSANWSARVPTVKDLTIQLGNPAGTNKAGILGGGDNGGLAGRTHGAAYGPDYSSITEKHVIIKNVTVEPTTEGLGQVTGANPGGIVGIAYNTDFVGCKTINLDMGGHYSGGIVGYCRRGTNEGTSSMYAVNIVDCHVYGLKIKEGGDIGGIVGLMEDTRILNSHAEADILGGAHTGGIVGIIEFSELTQTFWGNEIRNTYFRGSVTSMFGGGGLIGTIRREEVNEEPDGIYAPTFIIEDCYAIGPVILDIGQIENFELNSSWGEYYEGLDGWLQYCSLIVNEETLFPRETIPMGGLIGLDYLAEDLEEYTLLPDNISIARNYCVSEPMLKLDNGDIVSPFNYTHPVYGDVLRDYGRAAIGWTAFPDDYAGNSVAYDSVAAFGATDDFATAIHTADFITESEIDNFLDITNPSSAWDICDGETYPYLKWQNTIVDPAVASCANYDLDNIAIDGTSVTVGGDDLDFSFDYEYNTSAATFSADLVPDAKWGMLVSGGDLATGVEHAVANNMPLLLLGISNKGIIKPYKIQLDELPADTFQIWNWADLAYLNILIENEYNDAGLGDKKKLSDYDVYVLMQNLVKPDDEVDGSNGYDKDGVLVCPYTDANADKRRMGSYGYENWDGVPPFVPKNFYGAVDGATDLYVGEAGTTKMQHTTELGQIAGWEEDQGWIPIGRYVSTYHYLNLPFNSIFDGQGHEITGLWIDRGEPKYDSNDPKFAGQGLFGVVKGDIDYGTHFPAVIKNLGVNIMEADTVKGGGSVGALVGYSEMSEIINCYATGAVQGTGNIGGLVGSVEPYTKISNCYATGAVSALGGAGGLIGLLRGSKASNCYATGAVSGKNVYMEDEEAGDELGGLSGRLEDAKITNCYATGDVTGVGDLGGLVGYYTSSAIVNCYATGNIVVTATDYHGEAIGGLVGRGFGGEFIDDLEFIDDINGPGEGEPSNITNSYATGNIKAEGSAYGMGGLVGLDGDETIINSYATGNITVAGDNSEYIGGLVGNADGTEITNCYATGSITVEGDDSDYIGGLVGSIEDGATLSNSFAFNPQITVGSAADYVGRVAGYYDDGDADLSGNQALACMKVIVDGDEIDYVDDPDDKDGDVIPLGDVINAAGNDANYSGWDFTAGTGAWTFDYEYGNAAKKYNVTSTTNLPILQAFDTTLMAGFFADALQPPVARCAEPDTFEIWNWADLAYLNILIENEYNDAGLGDKKKISDYDAFVLMQNLGTPGSVPANYGDGEHGGLSGTVQCPYTDTNKANRKMGWYGYENWDGLATGGTFVPKNFYGAVDGATDLKVGKGAGITLPASELGTLAGWEEDAGWLPIGSSVGSSPFSGVFDGQGFAITGLWIDRETESDQGLFGYVTGTDETEPAIIKNLGVNIMEADTVKGGYDVGALVGTAGDWMGEVDVTYAKITNCFATGNVKGESNVGGLSGHVLYAEITNSYTTGDVIGDGVVGGFVAQTGVSKITNCYATGDVIGSGFVGGFVGEADNSVITNCYAIGAVKGIYAVGGFAGEAGDESEISNCYATGDITAEEEGSGSHGEFLGGLVGYAGETEITNCYATGSITAEEEGYYIGGLVGEAGYEAEISNCYATGSITVAGDGGDNIGGLVGSIEGNSTLSNSFAFAPQITVGSAADYVGRVAGYYDDNDAELSGNQAMECMKVIVDGDEISYVDDPDEKDGDVIPLGDVINAAGNDANYSGWTFTAGTGAWTFDYEYGNAAKKYNVTATTNLPILQAFDTTLMAGFFADALQPPMARCAEPDTFYIWNWADLAYLNILIENEYNDAGLGDGKKLSDYDVYVLMQNLGTPGSVPANYGDGEHGGLSGTVQCPYTGDNAISRKMGWYGYENWDGLATGGTFVPKNFYGATDGVTDLKVGKDAGITLPASEIGTLAGWEEVAGWLPIGSSVGSSPFSGVFDGQKFEITGLWIDRETTAEDQGLFGYVAGEDETEPVIIKNLGVNIMEADTVKGIAGVGALVGWAQYLEITNCFVTGNVKGGSNVGGLSGGVAYAEITNSYTTGNVIGGGVIGGFVAQAEYSKITNCYATSDVIGGDFVGGFVGEADYSVITNCYATGAVSGIGTVGGFVGGAYEEGEITNCYAIGNITAEYGGNTIGGLVGHTYGIAISNCYATGSITAEDEGFEIGGLVGYAAGEEMEISNCYATGSITVEADNSEYIGGLVGHADYETNISNSYATGNITVTGDNSEYIGGLVGHADGYVGGETEITNCYATGSITVAGDDVDYIGGLVGYITDGSTLSNSFAFAPQIEVKSAADYVGRIAGYNDGDLTGNQAMNCMKVIVDGDEIDYVDDPDDKDGDVIALDDVIQGSPFNANESTYTGWIFTAGTGAWTFDYEYGNAAKKYNVTSTTNLPILQAFDTTAMSGFFADALQPPMARCAEPDTFEIWNWADLAYLNILIENEYNDAGLGDKKKISDYDAFVLMQNLGTPGSSPANYGDGEHGGLSGTVQCPYTGANADKRKMGWYGYENWDGLATGGTFVPKNFYGAVDGATDLKVGKDAGITLPASEIGTLAGWEEDAGWLPIGWSDFPSIQNPFFGIFDGQGHEITGLWIDRETGIVQGLFGYVVGADETEPVIIKNLGVNIMDSIKAEYAVGALVGMAQYVEISNCYATGTVKGYSTMGVLAGQVYYSSVITNCYAIGAMTVYPGSGIFGGLVGETFEVTISTCYADCTIEAIAEVGAGVDAVGGLVGWANETEMTNSYASGNIMIESEGCVHIGGLVGISWNIEITNCYATDNITVKDNGESIGGLVGYVEEEGAITDCYATGNITVTGDYSEYIGGLVGYANGYVGAESEITNCYATGSITVEEGDNIGGLVGYITDDATLTNCFAFNPQITVESAAYYVGRVAGYYDDNLTGNQAMECMKVIVDGDQISCTDDPDDKDGGDIAREDVIQGSPFNANESTYDGWDFTGTWTFDYEYGNPAYPYNVTKKTNLPILQAFDTTIMSGFFAGALQPPRARCIDTFYIWNWADLAYLNILIKNENGATPALGDGKKISDYNVYALMQNLVHPDSINIPHSDGEDGGVRRNVNCDYMPPERQKGSYGYENWNGLGGFAPANDGTTLLVGKSGTNLDCNAWDVVKNTGWIPVGDSVAGYQFSEVFDGQYYTINNLWIERPDSNYQGLFGYVAGSVGDSARIKNLGVNIVKTVRGGNYVGGLVGLADYAAITNCYVTGGVNAADSAWAGGLAALAKHSTITNCYVSGVITARRICIGGLVAAIDSTFINACYANVDVWLSYPAYGDAGGLVGHVNNYSEIANCYATGYVQANGTIGGLVGKLDDIFPGNSKITNSYANCEVHGNIEVGGLVGVVGNYSEITNSLALNPIINSYYSGPESGRIFGHSFDGTSSFNHNYTTVCLYPFNSLDAYHDKKDGQGLSISVITDSLFYALSPLNWDLDNVWTFNYDNYNVDTTIYGIVVTNLPILQAFDTTIHYGFFANALQPPRLICPEPAPLWSWADNPGSDDGCDQFMKVIATSDGWLAVGQSNDISTDPGWDNEGMYDGIIVKYRLDGTVAWRASYGGTDWDGFTSVAETNDKYLILGYGYGVGTGAGLWTVPGGFVLSMDKNGANVKTELEGLPGITSMTTRDDDLVITGSGPFITKYTLNTGTETYDEVWTNTDGPYERINRSVILSDGSVIALGYFTNNTSIRKYDVMGNTAWTTNFGVPLDVSGFSDLALLTDGTLVTVGLAGDVQSNGGIPTNASWGHIGGPGTLDAIVVRFDANGDVLFSDNFGGSSWADVFNVVAPTNDGGYVVAGVTMGDGIKPEWYFNYTGSSENAVTVKFNLLNKVVWSRTTAATGFLSFESLAVNDLGFIAAAGSTQGDAYHPDFPASDWEAKNPGCNEALIMVMGYKAVPHAADTFQIWNWADLASVIDRQKSGTTMFKLMQDLGVPGGKNTCDTINYGDGSAMVNYPDALFTHKGDKRYGWYGYEGFIGMDTTTSYASYVADLPTIFDEYESGSWTTYGFDATTGWDASDGWTPIGDNTTPFISEFDGQGFEISGLWINSPTTSYVGLFGRIEDATVTNLGVVLDGSVIGSVYVGGLAGTAGRSKIENCFTKNGAVEATSQRAGGLIGGTYGDYSTTAYSNSISDCFSTCEVTAYMVAGGFIGSTVHTEVKNSYSTGNVEGTFSDAGGFIGIMDMGCSVTNCYTIGSVYSENTASGFVDGISSGSMISGYPTLQNCFALGASVETMMPSSPKRVYRFADAASYPGYELLVITNNYALDSMIIVEDGMERTGITNDGDGADASACDVTDKNDNFFSDATGGNWSDFSDHWTFNYVPDHVNVAAMTNLPVLRAFNDTTFSCAKQSSRVDGCNLLVTYETGGTPPGARTNTDLHIGTDDYCTIAPPPAWVSYWKGLGYEFYAWNSQDDLLGDTIALGQCIPITTDTIFYAMWRLACDDFVGSVAIVSQPNCAGTTFGKVYIDITGGIAPYTYSLNGVNKGAFPTDSIITDLTAGNYTIVVTDHNGCESVAPTFSLVSKDASTVVASITTTPADLCTGGAKGTVEVTVIGELGYTYSIENVNTGNVVTETTPNMAYIFDTLLLPGEYELTVFDANSCPSAGGKFTIGVDLLPFDLDFALTGIPGECASPDGFVAIKIDGVAADDTCYYSFDGGIWTELVGDTIAIPAAIGFHSVRLMSYPDSCISALDTITLIQENNDRIFTAKVLSTTATSCGDDNGTILLKMSPGTYNYHLTDSIFGLYGTFTTTTSDSLYRITDLPAGIYVVTIDNDDGTTVALPNCPYSFTTYNVEVRQGLASPVIAGSITVNAQPKCDGITKGSIKVAATGASDYEYSLNGGTTWYTLPTGGIITGLDAGNYTVNVRATGSSCGDISQTLSLTNSDALTTLAKLTTTPADDCSTPNGTVTFTVSGYSVFEYQVITVGGTLLPMDWIASTTATVTKDDLTSGDYELWITDAAGCENPAGTFSIGAEDSDMTFSTGNSQDANCNGGYGSFDIDVTDGDPTHYRLNGGAWVAITGSNPHTVSVPAGQYLVELRDGTCISLADTATIELDDSDLEAAFVSATATSCGEDNGTITLSISGTTTPLFYSIDGVKFEPTTTGTVVIDSLAAGVYDIQVKDGNGCITNVYAAKVPQGTDATVIAGSISVNTQPTTCSATNGSIKIAVTGAIDYEYRLSKNGVYIGTGFSALPANGILGGLTAGNYVVTVRAAHGDCSNDISQTLSLISGEALTVLSSLTTTPADNCGGTNSKVTFTVVGSTDYDYQIVTAGVDTIATNWTSKTTASVTEDNLASGDYDLWIKDGNGCAYIMETFSIGATSSGITFDVNPLADADCDGTYGSFEIDATGSAATHYRLNGGAWIELPATFDTILYAPAGQYIVELREGAGCISLADTATIELSGSDLEAELVSATATSCDENNGTITVKILDGTAPFYYSIDGMNFDTIKISATPANYTITDLSAGVYDVQIRDDDGCTTNVYAAKVLQGKGYSIIAGPSATTPQTFCDNATIANLQADGVDIKWYDAETDGTLLAETFALTHDAIYYAAQTTPEGCIGSERTAVKVIIDNTIVIDVPNISGEVTLCPATLPDVLTLADIPTNGNTNIIWFADLTSTTELPLTTPFAGDTTFYATLKVGDCESIARKAVNITIADTILAAPEIDTIQQFCPGALVANLYTPNNQILWYDANGNLLTDGTLLRSGFYYAAQKAGSCQSAVRTEVEVIIGTYPEPVAPPVQTTCGGKIVYLSDLMIIGTHIRWYDENLVEYTSPDTTKVVVGMTYYAAQTSGICESDTIPVYITDECYRPMGTVFPFVRTNDLVFNSKFTTLAKLYVNPPATILDKIGYVRKQMPICTDTVTYYNCRTDLPIIGAPRYPGTVGRTDNPGLPIRWSELGITNPGTPNPDTTTLLDPCLAAIDTIIGKFIFDGVAPGYYILELSRPGFLTRYGQIHITGNDYLGHRELLGGDVNGDLMIDQKDLSAIRLKMGTYGAGAYNLVYDFNGDKTVNNSDINVIRLNLGAYSDIYKETRDWIKP